MALPIPSLTLSLPSMAESAARSGDVSSYFTDGSFTVGGSSQSINWLFVIAGIVAVAFFMFRGKK